MFAFLLISLGIVALAVLILAARDIRSGTPAKLEAFPKVARLRAA